MDQYMLWFGRKFRLIVIPRIVVTVHHPGFISRFLSTCGGSGPTTEDDVEALLSRYSSLRKVDRMKLYNQHMGSIEASQDMLWSKINPKLFGNAHIQKNYTNLLPEKLKKRHIRKSSAPFSLKRFSKKQEEIRLENVGIRTLEAESFSEANETATLIEDRHSAEIYSDICKVLQSEWENKNLQSDSFLDVMKSALKDELMEQSRPTLVNEFTDHPNPYMMKRQSIRRILEERCVKNRLDASMVEIFLDRMPDLKKLRLNGEPPAEMIEPLKAFRGDVNYHFNSRERLKQKLSVIEDILQLFQEGFHKNVPKILSVLPENIDSASISENHPFANHFGFESATPRGYAGGIKMGKPEKVIVAELGKLRYPTLQRVAHSLPDDPKYRANTTHAIRILERSKGWDFDRKIEAINTLVEVWKNLGPSKSYERALDYSIESQRLKNLSHRKSKIRTSASKGLKYIKSLTTLKPLHTRFQTKK